MSNDKYCRCFIFKRICIINTIYSIGITEIRLTDFLRIHNRKKVKLKRNSTNQPTQNKK